MVHVGSHTSDPTRMLAATARLTNTTARTSAMIACTANPTLSWRGRKSQITPAANRDAERKVLRNGDDQAVHDGQTCHTLIGETFE